jgi:hypothetical protein
VRRSPANKRSAFSRPDGILEGKHLAAAIVVVLRDANTGIAPSRPFAREEHARATVLSCLPLCSPGASPYAKPNMAEPRFEFA